MFSSSAYVPAGNILHGQPQGTRIAPRAAKATFYRTLKEHMMVSPRLVAILNPAPLVDRLGYYEVVDTREEGWGI